MEPVRASDREPLLAPDGSSVRELLGPPTGTARNQSLAEATVAPGEATSPHLHCSSEEIYVFIAGAGEMTLGERSFEVTTGQSIAIAPGAVHWLRNTGHEPLVLLCCCSPPYSDDETELIDL